MAGDAAPISPSVHQLAPLLEEVTTAVSRLNLALNGVSQRHLDYFAREVCGLASPVAERGSEAVNREIRPLHSLQQLQHRHVGLRLAAPTPREDVLTSLSAHLLKDPHSGD